MTNGANASYVNETLRQMSCTCVSILMSSVKWNPRFFAVVENDMTLCPNKREVQFKFCAHLIVRIRTHSVFSSFNCNMFSIIQYLTSETHVSTEEIVPLTCWGRIEVLI